MAQDILNALLSAMDAYSIRTALLLVSAPAIQDLQDLNVMTLMSVWFPQVVIHTQPAPTLSDRMNALLVLLDIRGRVKLDVTVRMRTALILI